MGLNIFFQSFFFLVIVFQGFRPSLFLLSIQNILINFFYIRFSLSHLISTIFALFTSFLLNNYFTFSDINNKNKSNKKLIQYFITNAFTIMLNVLIASIIFSQTANWLISSLSGSLLRLFLILLFTDLKYGIINI